MGILVYGVLRFLAAIALNQCFLQFRPNRVKDHYKVPEARDRLIRQDVPAELYLHFLLPSRFEIFMDEPERHFGTPIRRGQMGVAAMRAGTVGRGRFGHENVPPVRTGGRVLAGCRTNGSVQPSWYPRIHLNDITAVVKVMERRGTLLRGVEGLEIGTPTITPRNRRVLHTPRVFRSGAQLEHEFSHTPRPTKGKKHCPPSTVGKVPKILLDITYQNNGNSEFLTPQKKLLNSIDTVEKVVMEELNKLKWTPSAKKVEREKKVRVLMSMR